MKKIELTQGKFALVDDEDYEWLNQWKWFAMKETKTTPSTWYAGRKESVNDNKERKRYPVSMHRQIMKCKRGDNKQVDHINHNGLDNRRENLRLCSKQENFFNRRPKGKASKFKGLNKCGKKWQSAICFKGEKFFLGTFETEKEAALAYDNRAKELFGEFAYLNFPREEYD